MITMKDVTFGYTKKKKLFSDLALDLSEGNIYGLLGKNGAGKTTLLKIMTGLMFPEKGTCRVLDFDVRERNVAALRELFLIPEDFSVPNLKSRQYLDLYSPLYPRFDRNIMESYIQEFEIPENESLTALSYGQKKKFLVAFALATDCRLLVFDEPTNGLDIPSKSQFRKLVASALTENRTFVISTHQVRDMERIIDPVIILDEGSIIFQQDSGVIGKKLTISLTQDKPADDEALYYEKVLGGWAVISQNKRNNHTQIDLELLFNAVTRNKDRITRIFMED
ncbi:MAG: ABC transporter ATP-binding protein [Spirochaetales bacterium]|nr:MAG: ABC transporter ATP-binding protein [Spirochaetales bacterium]